MGIERFFRTDHEQGRQWMTTNNPYTHKIVRT